MKTIRPEYDPRHYRFERTSGIPHGYFEDGRKPLRWWLQIAALLAVCLVLLVATDLRLAGVLVMATEFRIAIRAEGTFVNAYHARAGTMDEAVLLGSIRERLAAMPGVFNARLAVMQSAVAAMYADLGMTGMEWGEPERAPEHERSGSA